MSMKGVVTYPTMRAEVMIALADLGDEAGHTAEWFAHAGPGRSLDATIHTLFDDIPVFEDTEGYVGIMLRSDREVELVKQLGTELEAAWAEYGTFEDPRLAHHPCWTAATATARVLLAVMVRNWGIPWPTY